MELTLAKNEWGQLSGQLERLERNGAAAGAQLMEGAARRLEGELRHRLETQGRGGQPPPLSQMSRHIYRITGGPDGSGIRNHLVLEFRQRGSQRIATVGIPVGRPSLIARVQDRGAIVPVSAKMRRFLAAAYGIYLRASTTHIRIPGRRFWELSVESARRQTRRELTTFFRLTLER